MNALTPFTLKPGLSVASLLDQMQRASFGARSVGHAWNILQQMLDDEGCPILLTMSGALGIGQIGGAINTMVDRKMLHAIVTTGAVVTHQLVNELGYDQYQIPDQGIDDELLIRKRLNRIYDAVEPECNLEHLGEFVSRCASGFEGNYSSAALIRHLVSALDEGGGWLSNAIRHGIPVFVPALTDSELGLALHSASRIGHRKEPGFQYCAMLDLAEYSGWLEPMDRLSIITLGGGAPRNWAMQMIPYMRSIGAPAPVIARGIRICPDVPMYGHLSGSTYSEATTWGKIESNRLSGFSEVLCDATIVFPLLIQGALDRKFGIRPQGSQVIDGSRPS